MTPPYRQPDRQRHGLPALYNYNPDLFWDASDRNREAVLPRGPNKPVGVVWIDLDSPIMASTGRQSLRASGARKDMAAFA